MYDFETRVNQSLGWTLNSGPFNDLRNFLITFTSVPDICPLPDLLFSQTRMVIELALYRIFMSDSEFGYMLEDPVSLDCMRNASFPLVEKFHKELKTSLERKLYDMSVLVSSFKLASHILEKIQAYYLHPSCVVALTRMNYCPLCAGYSRFSPCIYLCINTLRGCFADVAELHPTYTEFITSLRVLAHELLEEFTPTAFITDHLNYFVEMINELLEKEDVLREAVSNLAEL